MSKFGVIHIDKALTDFSVAYSNGVYVAERVAPVVLVDYQTDKYFVHGKNRFKVMNDMRAPGTPANPSHWELSNDSYYCQGHALKDSVAPEDAKNADPGLDLATDTTEVLTDQVLLNQEVSLVATLEAGMTGNSLADQSSQKWDNDANDPIAIIDAEKPEVAKRIGRMPNILVLSAPLLTAFGKNAKVRGRITGAPDLPSAGVTPQQLASLLQLDEVIIASAVKDTAADGQAASLDFVWGKNALLAYRPPSAGRKIVALTVTFVWRNAGQTLGGQNVGGQFVRRWFDQNAIADMVEVHKYYDQKIVDAGAGCLFTNCIA
ncbi:MAG: hypothetical protein ACM3S5_13865 [Rhodospirillales bacterium]